jgi:hypothetical protein
MGLGVVTLYSIITTAVLGAPWAAPGGAETSLPAVAGRGHAAVAAWTMPIVMGRKKTAAADWEPAAVAAGGGHCQEKLPWVSAINSVPDCITWCWCCGGARVGAGCLPPCEHLAVENPRIYKNFIKKKMGVAIPPQAPMNRGTLGEANVRRGPPRAKTNPRRAVSVQLTGHISCAGACPGKACPRGFHGRHTMVARPPPRNNPTQTHSELTKQNQVRPCCPMVGSAGENGWENISCGRESGLWGSRSR